MKNKTFTLKELRKMFKGINGKAKVGYGMSYHYSNSKHEENAIEIDLYLGKVIRKGKGKIDEIIFWCEE